jgi:hypothetical protein
MSVSHPTLKIRIKLIPEESEIQEHLPVVFEEINQFLFVPAMQQPAVIEDIAYHTTRRIVQEDQIDFIRPQKPVEFTDQVEVFFYTRLTIQGAR